MGKNYIDVDMLIAKETRLIEKQRKEDEGK